jgi:protoporphyrinogen oxidase
LITTMPLNLLLQRITHCTRSHLPQAAPRLRCNSVLNINLGIAREQLNDHHWLYVPDTKYSCYRVGFWHNVSKGMVPAGHSALYAECSYLPERTSGAARLRLRQRCLHDVMRLLKLSKSEIVLEHDLHLPHAYVLYDHWRKKHIEGILRALAEYGIHSTGRFGGWKYSSMQEAVLDGREAATWSKEFAILPRLERGTRIG